MQELQYDLKFFTLSSCRIWNFAGLFELKSLVDKHRQISAVIKNERWSLCIRPIHRLICAPPIFGERFALPRKDWDASRFFNRSLWPNSNRCGSVILCRENIA